MADVEFDMPSPPTPPAHWAMASIPLGFLLVFAFAAASEGSGVLLVIVVIFLLAMAAILTHIARITPHRATLTDNAVELHTKAGPRQIPWSDLVSIRLGEDHLYWTLHSQRGAIQTPGGFPDLERLLTEIKGRAPQVEIKR